MTVSTIHGDEHRMPIHTWDEDQLETEGALVLKTLRVCGSLQSHNFQEHSLRYAFSVQ